MLSNKKWEPLRTDIDYLQKIEAKEAKKNEDQVQGETTDQDIGGEGNDDDSSFDDLEDGDEGSDGLKKENTRDEL